MYLLTRWGNHISTMLYMPAAFNADNFQTFETHSSAKSCLDMNWYERRVRGLGNGVSCAATVTPLCKMQFITDRAVKELRLFAASICWQISNGQRSYISCLFLFITSICKSYKCMDSLQIQAILLKVNNFYRKIRKACTL